MNDTTNAAREFFLQGNNCTQSVFHSVIRAKNKEFKEALALSAGFGGGIAMNGLTCGAVTGAIMALGVLEAEKGLNAQEHRDSTYSLANEFIKRFKDENGTIKCDRLIGHTMSDPESRKEARESGIFREFCPGLVESAVRIVEEIIKE